MFLVTCQKCGWQQKWKDGVKVQTAAIQVAGFVVTCDCGNQVVEEEGILRERPFDPNRINDEE